MLHLQYYYYVALKCSLVCTCIQCVHALLSMLQRIMHWWQSYFHCVHALYCTMERCDHVLLSPHTPTRTGSIVAHSTRFTSGEAMKTSNSFRRKRPTLVPSTPWLQQRSTWSQVCELAWCRVYVEVVRLNVHVHVHCTCVWPLCYSVFCEV